MNSATRRLLLDVNRRFYAQKADAFGASRRWPWPGWTRLVDAWYAERKGSNEPFRVYDVGCGNGRFGAFLFRRLDELRSEHPVHYLAVDVEPALLDQALSALGPVAAERQNIDLDLRVLDLEHDLPSRVAPGKGFDLVVCFGVLHHVPGRAERLALVDDLGACLARSSEADPGGRLAVSRWMLHRRERFARKRRDFAELAEAPDPAQLEPGDTLLGWQHDPEALRYLAFPDREEQDLHRRRPGLAWIEDFPSDGASGEDNHYWVWRRARD